MDVVVSGSTGLIGSALVADLLADGHAVARLVRPDSTPVGDATTTIEWDPTAGTIDATGLEGADALVHLSGENIGARRWNDAQRARILESRTRTTSLLSDTLARLDRPPPVWLSGSATGFYGDRGDVIVDETDPVGDDFLADVCRQWEAAAVAPEGVRLTLLRTGVVLATESGALAEALPFFRLGLGGRMGPGDQYWSWIGLPDQIAAIRMLLTHDVHGPVNLCAPTPVTNRQFTTALGQALHRPTFIPTPKFALYAKLGRQLAEALLFTSTRARPAALLDAGFEFAHPTIDGALEHLLGSGSSDGSTS